MIYVMSDIHGEYDKYKAMLEKINFSDNDELYILGDVIDRGPEPVRILQDMAMRHNVYPIFGNHELMALDVLKALAVDVTEDNYASQITTEIINKMYVWQNNGGDITLAKFKALPNNERQDLIEYMEEFAPYEVLKIGNKKFVLVHSTLGSDFDESKPLDSLNYAFLAFDRTSYNRSFFTDENTFVVSGHTPTITIHSSPTVYRMCNNINIDCGAVFGGRLACLCLDTMKEYYI